VEDTHNASIRPRRTTRSSINWRVRPLEMLVGILHMLLEVLLLVVALILVTKELSMLLGVLLTHMIETQANASKLIRKELTKGELLRAREAGLIVSSTSGLKPHKYPLWHPYLEVGCHH